MAATSYRGRYDGGRGHTHSSSLRRSISPSGGLRCSFASAFAASSPRSSALLHRSASPTRVIFAGPSPPPRSIRFTVASFHGHHSQQHRVKRPVVGSSDGGGRRRMCMCSPTTHPGSFRCRLHPQGHRRASAMTNSLVRIGAVEGRAGAAVSPRPHPSLLPPAARRAAFEHRPSRLSVMSKAGDDDLRSRSRFPVDP
ncbi:hypothetical protein B296_00031656 [Ensete ventricosum]|uniref:Uncharacterized protein n=1 Tax=Ensete ventricosum TaxID=4639 RepID=A0A426Y0A2_ENSVE|nr:hypothetical protein B296_00031656 [Ensete ventricosum]